MVQLVPGDDSTRYPTDVWFDSLDNFELAVRIVRLAVPRYRLATFGTSFMVHLGAVRLLPPRVPAAAYTVQVRLTFETGTRIETFDVVRRDLLPGSRKAESG